MSYIPIKSDNWIDFNKCKKYTKKLPQALEPDELITELQLYFSTKKKFNVYTLSLHLGMSKDRFDTQYKNSKNETTKEIIQSALSAIAGHALENEEEYSRSLRYILAHAETGKHFIELSEEVQDSNQAKIIVLPTPKD